MKYVDQPSRIINYIKHITKRGIIVLGEVSFIIGIVINFFLPYKNFFIYQIALLAIILISINAIKDLLYCFDNISDLRMNPEIVGERKKTENKLNSNTGAIIATLVVIVYYICIYLLKYIQFDLMGFYATALGGTALFVAIIGYYQFVQILLFVRSLRKVKIQKYNRYIPANTKWLLTLTRQIQLFKNYFLILGLLFTSVYGLLILERVISFAPNFIIKPVVIEAKIPFLVSWGGIFIFIIFAFPLFSYLFDSYIKNIVITLKCQTIAEFEKMLSIELNKYDKNRTISIEHVNVYTSLIKQVDSSRNFPVETPKSIAYLLTSLTIGVHSITIITGVFDMLKLKN